MKRLLYSAILFFFFTLTCLAQKDSKPDQLIAFGHQYPLVKEKRDYSDTVIVCPSPEIPYEYAKTGKSISYIAIQQEDCTSLLDYDTIGEPKLIDLCKGKKQVDYSLYDLIDTIHLDAKKTTGMIIKRKGTSIPVFKINYTAIYDSMAVVSVLNSFEASGNYYFSWLYKSYGKPTYIIARDLFYRDPKDRRTYLLPCSFILVP
jgi:hypothetical protein